MRGETDVRDMTVPQLRAHRDGLERRLTEGDAKIDTARRDGTPSTTIAGWEDFWVSLLHEYQRVCDELAKRG
jgi:hypothetical protein